MHKVWMGAFCGAVLCGCSAGGDTDSAATSPSETVPEAIEGEADQLIPARIIRLSNTELDNTLAALLQTSTSVADSFPRDVRQAGYTANQGQVVDSIWATQIATTARELADDAVSTRLKELAPCADDADADCARSFIETFGGRAYRRELSKEEIDDLLAVYTVGEEVGGFERGIALILRAMLQSPSFVYRTELGADDVNGSVVSLTQEEVATALSYSLTGAPPDAALWEAVEDGSLSSAEDRRSQAERLLSQPSATPQVQRFVKEWLGIDDLESIGKDAVFSDYLMLRPLMTREANDFIGEVFRRDDPTVSTLLGADYTVAAPQLGEFYGIQSSEGSRALWGAAPRRGILHQAAFLSAHSNLADSGPVLRGAELLGTVLCLPVPDPAEAGVLLNVPPPDPNVTTRQRFSQHSQEQFCSGCHSVIDPLGFSFEHYDAMGNYREMDNGLPVDASGAIPEGVDVSGPVADSLELAERLSSSKDVEQCFARQLLRFASAQSNQSVEDRFVTTVWEGLDAEEQGNLTTLLLAIAASDTFVFRRLR